jgi:arylsulfatase A-like enzyme
MCPPTQRSEITFEISAESGTGSVSLFEGSIPLSGHETPESRWREAEVDLGRFAGREVTIVMKTKTGEAFDPLDGLPTWANPEITWPFVAGDAPNVVIISLDTLRADHTTMYGYERPTTPNIEKWARESGTLFRTAVAAAPWTLPSHVSLFTGLDSLVHGVIHTDPAPGSLVTLAELLRDRGYATAAVTGGSYLNPRYGLSQGFDRHRSVGGDLETELERELAYAIHWLQSYSSPVPFFLFFHTYEVHDPYTPREPFLSRITGSEADPEIQDIVTSPTGADRDQGFRPMRNLKLRFRDDNRPPEVLPWSEVSTAVDYYDSGIAFADRAIGELLDALAASEHADRTVVVLLADHGEAFGEHGFASHSSLYDHDLLVPLIVAPVAGTRVVREVETQVRLVDVMPTILDLVGAEAPAGLSGRSLLPLMQGRRDDGQRDAFSYAAVTNFGISLRQEDHKYIFRNSPFPATTGWEELYDLAADPSEFTNLAPAESPDRWRQPVLDHMRDHLGGVWITVANPAPTAIEGHLESAAIGTGVRTTTVHPQCRLVAGRRLEFKVPPGESLTVVIERPEGLSVHVSGNLTRQGSGPAAPFDLELDLSGESAARSLRMVGGRWIEAEGGDGAADVAFRWEAPPGDRYETLEVDGELEEQLRALGYIQ